ncbi:MAG TPA: hypothetical protein VE715_04500 [Blastocatellia bacterium]|nr:hypothetical protein [Blastocatellia bacterium]
MDRIIRARITRGLTPRVTEKDVIDVPAQQSQPLWKPALEALSEMLKRPIEARTQAFVTLSNRFVRYTMVPWHDELMKRNERLVQARHCFKQTYGEVADKWSITSVEGRYREPFLATAVDPGLIDGLRKAFGQAHIELISISPYLTSAYSRFRRVLNAQGATTYFSVVEQADIGTLCFDSKGLRNVFNQRIQEDWTQELRGTLMQSAGDGLGEGAARALCLFAPDRPQESIQGSGSTVTRLFLPAVHGFSPVSDSRISMALAGIG